MAGSRNSANDVVASSVGRYAVVDTSERRLQGTDGWMSTILATEGRANVEATDT